MSMNHNARAERPAVPAKVAPALDWRVVLAVIAAGTLFGFGLCVSTMIRPEAVLSFLRGRNYGLLLVMTAAAAVVVLAYQLLPRVLSKPLFNASFDQQQTTLNRRMCLGAAIFGVGWGLSGVCPGPAIAALGTGQWKLGLALVGMAAGAYVQGRFFGRS